AGRVLGAEIQSRHHFIVGAWSAVPGADMRRSRCGCGCGWCEPARRGVFRSRTANDYSAQVTLTVGVLIACSLALGIWAAVRTARDQPVITRQLIGSAVIEAGILVQMVLAGVLVATGHQIADGFTFWGYLVVALLVLPAAAV